MTRRRLGVAAATMILAASMLLLGGVLRRPSAAGTAPLSPSPTASGASLETGSSAGKTEDLVEGLQATLRGSPNDIRSLDLLGLAYQQRARETGDPTYYTKSEGVLNRALGFDPRDLLATSSLGSGIRRAV